MLDIDVKLYWNPTNTTVYKGKVYYISIQNNIFSLYFCNQRQNNILCFCSELQTMYNDTQIYALRGTSKCWDILPESVPECVCFCIVVASCARDRDFNQTSKFTCTNVFRETNVGISSKIGNKNPTKSRNRSRRMPSGPFI